MILDLDIWRCAAVVICASIPHLMVASFPAMAHVTTPSLASTQAMSVALLVQGQDECWFDSSRIDDTLRSLVDGPGFPQVAYNKTEYTVSSQLLVIVTAIPQPKTPGVNPTTRDRTTTCRVSGRALLLHSNYVPNQPQPDIVVEPEESGTLLWRAEAATGEDLSPADLNVHAERIIRELAERFSADWRQSQGR